ncbi:hypothetical protein B0H11DRAFT_1923866 [Mycena galericulata]|nr:hypothetical protein B0H11DRAFT_1923866 [Mycena galericulata]
MGRNNKQRANGKANGFARKHDTDDSDEENIPPGIQHTSNKPSTTRKKTLGALLTEKESRISELESIVPALEAEILRLQVALELVEDRNRSLSLAHTRDAAALHDRLQAKLTDVDNSGERGQPPGFFVGREHGEWGPFVAAARAAVVGKVLATKIIEMAAGAKGIEIFAARMVPVSLKLGTFRKGT